jgi:predicted solute-binding protein
MKPTRLGVVGYLNAWPLAHGLEDHPDQVRLRFDEPSQCARLLHENAIDIGLIPSIEYLRRTDYTIVPDLAVTSNGAAASVALFSPKPISAIRSIALDSSSKTSATLLKILCARWFEIQPEFVTVAPEMPAMLDRCDAALLIGDRALFTDHEAMGLDKIDLGEQWLAMTGLPFVYAFWAGREEAITPDIVTLLHDARDRGVSSLEQIARKFAGGDERRVDVAFRYLRDNLKYRFGDAERAGVEKFFDAAAELGIVPANGQIRFYEPRAREVER